MSVVDLPGRFFPCAKLCYEQTVSRSHGSPEGKADIFSGEAGGCRVGGKRLRTWRVSPLTSRPGLITPTGRCQLGRAGQVFFWGFGPGSGDPFPCQALGPVKVQHPMNPLASCKMGDARAVWGWCGWSCETWPKVLGSTSAFTGAMTVFRGTPRGLQVCLPKVAGVQT